MPNAEPVHASGDVTDRLALLIAEAVTRDKNEAETRHKIIDFVLHDFLAWPKNRVEVEKSLHPGYADYVLKKSTGDDLLFVEAKREGMYFELPISYSAKETSTYLAISKLLSDDSVKTAITQVRSYCFDTGCEYACVTNGHEWIFFKTFEKGKRWEQLQAFVIRSLNFFLAEYTKAFNNLSYVAITERSSLSILLSSTPPKDRSIYYPKEKISSYAHTITSNKLASTLKPVVTHYFGVIEDGDSEFMDKCYVSQRDYRNTSDSVRIHIQDSLSPYFESFGVRQLEETGRGGQLGGRLKKGLQRVQTKRLQLGRRGEVVVLFGGKGSGKSTFIKRLLFHKQPPWLQQHAIIVIVDLLDAPEEQSVIRDRIWSTLIARLDVDHLLDSERSTLVRELFWDKFATARKQDLFGLSGESEQYNARLNDLISAWKKDYIYCAKRLSDYLSDSGRGIIVVVDNTDQFSPAVQDFCFSSAQEIANALRCVTLISMREERFHNSKIHGLLDAFQNAGFHISSPKPADVFRKRLQYTTDLLRDAQQRDQFFGDVNGTVVHDSCVYLGILLKEFSSDKSPLKNFLTACAHGDIRLSLDLFRSFILSGYTNVEEMVANGSWNFQIHQVIKPVMIPTRYFYDEKLSDIPNIYQIL